jgi:hypothetical protein
MPFTRWTTPRDAPEILDFVAAHDPAANVDPVQCRSVCSCPRISAAGAREDLREQLGPYEPKRLSYT